MFISEAPPNLPEDLKLLYEDTVRAASIAHAMHRAMADPDSTFTLESLPPNVDNLSQAVQHSKAGLRRLESELNAVSGCRTHSNYHVAAVTEADRILAAAGRILLARAGIESNSPTDPAEVRRYFQGVPSVDLFSLVCAMRQEICAAGSARESKQDDVRTLVPGHSADFRSVHWFGNNFSFTANQAACIEVLWEAWENKTPEVGDATVLERAGIDAGRLAVVFRGHAAWNSMIRPGQSKGTHRLVESTP